MNLLVVEYIMDNSGMEALCDLILSDYLVTHCGVTKVNFRVKPMPWFVSDVTVKDFNHILDTLVNHTDPLIKTFGERWKNYVQKGEYSY